MLREETGAEGGVEKQSEGVRGGDREGEGKGENCWEIYNLRTWTHTHTNFLTPPFSFFLLQTYNHVLLLLLRSIKYPSLPPPSRPNSRAAHFWMNLWGEGGHGVGNVNCLRGKEEEEAENYIIMRLERERYARAEKSRGRRVRGGCV